MCNAGIDILDVYPMSESYPSGTGINKQKPWDAVHFEDHTFTAVENLLEDYFSDK